MCIKVPIISPILTLVFLGLPSLQVMVLSPSTPATTFATPIEQNSAELINERLDSWTLTLSSAVDYFLGNFISWSCGVLTFTCRDCQM